MNIDHKLRNIAEKLRGPCSTAGLLQGKMGVALFFFNYVRLYDNWYEEYANQLLDAVIESLQNNLQLDYANGLAGIGAGIEYLVQQGFIGGESNEILANFDSSIHHFVSRFQGHINSRNGLIGYGKYYLMRMNNPKNCKNANPSTELIKKQLIKIVDCLSTFYNTFEDIYSVIGFLPDIIALDINKEKACIYLNYAVDKLETMVYEDVYFGKYPGDYNPLIASVLLFRAERKTGNKELGARALFFLKKYESDFRQYLSMEKAIKWSFLYHFLCKVCNSKTYKELSVKWLRKITDIDLNSENGILISSGLMLLAIDKLHNDDWLDLFYLY